MSQNPFPFTGLSDDEVEASRQRFGSNAFNNADKSIWLALKGSVTEPMFVLLVIAAALYFTIGDYSEAFFMLAAILLVSAISFYQDSRSRKALAELKELTQTRASVIRNNEVITIETGEIVINDLVVIDEGTLVPADGIILHSNDFAVNESILTGESFSIFKNKDEGNNEVLQGTQVVSGLALIQVIRIGVTTNLGKVAKLLEETEQTQTPLQTQIKDFVKKMAIGGTVVFLTVWGINFSTSKDVIDSLLKALTLAMSVLPEEIPVAFTTFMALGASRLMKSGIIVKNIRTVETLGSATVICVDKTGTITENRMELQQLYAWPSDRFLEKSDWISPEGKKIITLAMWASEPVPFDPMEHALHKAYKDITEQDERPNFKMVHEYPLSGRPPIMTHVFENATGNRIIACKGAPESTLKHSALSKEDQQTILNRVNELSNSGYRVLGIATTDFEGNGFPKNQQDFTFTFIGLVAFFDPPKSNIKKVFDKFYEAGIQIKIITGDITNTTIAVARKAGFKNAEPIITGEELAKFDDKQLGQVVDSTNIFTRTFPETKVRIVNALKKINHVVAMTGDGINDGPALKAAHIGIAMGKRGAALAKEAAALILTDDDLGKMVDAIAMGRKIYSNLKKAVQYIVSIHIPIILTVLLPLLFGWMYPSIFTPVHVIFLELIMGPTCSIVYENESLEPKSMQQPPRKLRETFLSWRELSISVIQGLVITAGTLAIYQYAVQQNMNENGVRTMAFTTLILANIFLTYVNRSFYYSTLKMLRNKNWLLHGIVGISLFLLIVILKIPVFREFFQLQRIGGTHLIMCGAASFCSVIWIDMYKWWKRIHETNSTSSESKR